MRNYRVSKTIKRFMMTFGENVQSLQGAQEMQGKLLQDSLETQEHVLHGSLERGGM